MMSRLLAGAALLFVAPSLWAAGALEGEVVKQATNYTAIAMFLVFIAATMGITKWAAKRNTSTSDYYTAGGSITGFQNGMAIAGDYMSAASFLGISALVFASGYDGLIYSIGFLVGWPIILFMIAERLRNLGKFTFSDVASYRLGQTQIRILSAFGSLTVVAFYLIAQMVGAGKLIQLLFGLDYLVAVVLVGVLMVMYVLFGGMLATTWVQIIKAILLLSGATFMAIMVMKHVGFDFGRLFSEAISVHAKGESIMSPGGLVSDPISAISLGLALMFGTAGLPHILMRFFTVADAKEARKSVFYATGFIGYFYILTFIIGFGAILLVGTNPEFKDASGAIVGGNNMVAVHLASAVGAFTPMTVRPDLINRDEIGRALVRDYPPLLRDASIGGTAVFWFLIDETGKVIKTELKTSSGYPALDEAAAKVAAIMRFTPAKNRDKNVPVWIEIPILFQAR